MIDTDMENWSPVPPEKAPMTTVDLAKEVDIWKAEVQKVIATLADLQTKIGVEQQHLASAGKSLQEAQNALLKSLGMTEKQTAGEDDMKALFMKGQESRKKL